MVEAGYEEIMKRFLIIGVVIFFVASGFLTSRAFFRADVKEQQPRAANLPPQRETRLPPRRKWRSDSVPLNKSADIIVYGDNGHAAIAGVGTVLVSRDNGLTWKSLEEGPGDWRITTDGGVTYRESGKQARKITTRDLCNAETAVIAPSGRLYLRSVCEHTEQIWSIPLSDDKAPWHVVTFTYDGNPANGVYGPSSDFVLAGDRVVIEGSMPTGPVILTSDDNGSSWRPFWNDSLFFGKGLAAFDFIEAQTGWILLGNGELRKTSDGGQSWTTISKLPREVGENAFALKFTNASKAYIVGSDGLILISDDGGITWQRPASPVSHDLYKVVGIDANYAWAVGASNVILETSDGGNTWLPIKLDIADSIYHRLSISNGRVSVCSGKSIFSSS
jgi:photosystem II stability/assembly factor-like uncharacterized protein